MSAASESMPGDDLSSHLEAAARGDDSAWRVIVGLYARRVFALAKSRLRQGELAEEVTQSVFCTIASKLGRNPESQGSSDGAYTERGRFEAWLFRVAVNRIRDEVRRARRQAVPTDPEQFSGLAGSPATPTGVDGSAELDALRRAMLELSPPDREIVELRHHAGLSFAQIAEVLAEPLGTLLARHHRALRKLKDAMTQGASGTLEVGGTSTTRLAESTGTSATTMAPARSPRRHPAEHGS